MAGIGGLSALLGWTEVQQQTSKGFLGGGSNIIKGVRPFTAWPECHRSPAAA